MSDPASRATKSRSIANDAHLHLFRYGYRADSGDPVVMCSELDLYTKFRVRYGIDLALVIGYQGDQRYLDDNSYILQLAEQHRWIRPFAYVDPASGPDDISALLGAFTGLSIYPPGRDDQAWWRWFDTAMRVADEHAALVSLNAPVPTHPLIAAVLADTARVCVMLSHLGLPGRVPDPESAHLGPLRELALHDRVWVKISGIYATSPRAHRYPHLEADRWMGWLLEHVPLSHLVWGSDFAPCLEYISFPQVLDPPQLDHLDDVQRRMIMGGNLLQMLSEESVDV